MDVAQWLNGVGLGQYEALFREHEIDADVLPDLTEADLEKIGVPLGHRKRLMRAIGGLASNEAPPPAAKPAPAAPSPSAVSRADAERRPITVMFCDLVGSTGLAARLDAEDWRNLVGAYLDEASGAVTGLGGHVLKKLGDGLMALFGYPRAQENDGERAVRAALAIQRALAELNARNAKTGAPELAARIGLDTGPVVVDAAGEVFGEAPNVAARVQAAAEPGAVLVTAAVQRQTAGLFVAEDKGEHQLKGLPNALTLYRIVRASGAGRRGGARILTPLVGREDELSLLMRRWSRASQGEGQFVQIVGEPGIGKSRLIEEFHAKLGETPHTWVEWASSQLLQNTPLHPLAEWGRQRFGGLEVAGERRLADLGSTLRLIGLDAAEYAPLLAPLFDVPLPKDREAKFPPEELRRRQLTAITALFLAGARSQPVILAFEDLHWADPTSVDLLRALAERGAQAPLFIIATMRPDFHPPWSLRSHHSVVSLAPLNRGEVARMVGELASRHALPKDVIDGVSERTGGVPLFVEEVTRLLLERGVEGGAQAIPPTLQQSLAARLDRLGPARETAQIGAVLGRHFTYALLEAVSGLDAAGVHSALDRLAEADLLIAEGGGPQANYRFKHALIQDAAYESMLKSRRQALHRRAAEVLRDAEAEPEAIAHHFTQAGLDDLAIEWWGKAGDQALRRSAFQEAIAHLGKAIAMADAVSSGSVPEGSARSGAQVRRFKLESTYAQAVGWAKGFGAGEAKTAFDRFAHALAADSTHGVERAIACQVQWATAFSCGETASAREASESFVKAAEGAGTLPGLAAAHRSMGATFLAQGDLAESSKFFEQALKLSDRSPERDRIFGTGPEPAASAAAQFSLAAWMLGAPDRSRALIEEAVARAERIEHVPTQTVVRYFAALLEMLRGDARACLPLALSMIDFCRDRGVEQFLGAGTAISAWARARVEGPDPGLLQFREAVAALYEQGHRLYLPFYLGRLAEIEIAENELDAAVSRIRDAQELARDTGQRVSDVFLQRLLGEALLAADRADTSAAETALLAAIQTAQQQNARSFGLQAALSLARLYQSAQRFADAHAVLAAALDGFSPTPEMPEIAEAEALLAALEGSEEGKEEAAQRLRMTRLQVAYGNALIAARGFGAPETTEAFARARDCTPSEKDAPERLAADFGLWAGAYTRGELASMRAHAAAFLADVEARPDSGEAGVAHRAQGITHWFAGEFLEASDHLERALALFQSGRDDDLAYRFGMDPGVPALAYLGFTLWFLGEIDRAVSLVECARERLRGLAHANTLALGTMHAAYFGLMRGKRSQARTDGFELARIVREHDLRLFRTFGGFLEGWAAADAGALDAGLKKMRRGAASLREQNALVFDGLINIVLAEAEAQAGDPERAIAVLDEALATVERAGFRAFEAELQRVRGEILLQSDPSDLTAAESAFESAVAVAHQQGARSFELRAALSLAKLYQSTGRPVEAHGVLAPALEGFKATLEMPEIAEAQALLAALEETDEVKAAAAQRRRTAQLRVAYGNALIATRGYGAPETIEAFTRARESAVGDKGASERLADD